MLTLSVLGPVALHQDGVARRVPGGKTTELLVRLALEPGVPVRAEQLLDDLWHAPQHPASLNTLQVKVSRLRRALADPTALRAEPAGYTLVVEPSDVDATRVLRLVEEAASLRTAGDLAAAVRMAEHGLAMFSGDVLPGAGEASWVSPYRARLESTRLNLVEHRVAARVALGEDVDVVAELEALVSAHPLQESFWALLVTALYRSGRQADALAASTRVRHRLADELGIDPGPELQTLEQQVRRHDPRLAVPRQRVAVPAHRVAGNLPVDLASLVGRRADLEQLGSAVGVRRLVTVTGPAGVGKTRLALEVAHRTPRPAGSWLARLESAQDEATVWHTIGEALRLDAPSRAAVTERLVDADALVVLDNCEHLVDEVAEVVRSLLAAATGVRILATSQLPLRVAGEHVLGLEPLGPADSFALFTERATSQRPYPTDDEDTARLVAEVCRSLDGLPLAIELAAARTKVLPVREIARRLQDRFALLRDPTSTRPQRRTTLRAALSWSYDLLFPDDQRGLWALSVFTGGAPLPAVESVLHALGVPSEAALDVVSRLVDRSLVSADIPERGHARYRLLESVRELALERLHAAGLFDVAAEAHAAWFAAAADRAATAGRGPDQPEHVDLARAERANIDAALAWCAAEDPPRGLRTALGFGWIWVVMGTGADGARRVRAAVAATPSASATDRAAALTLCGWFEASGGDLTHAEADLEQAIRIGDARSQATGRLHLAFVHTQGGRPAEALTLLARCRPELERLGLAWEEAASWLLAAWAHISTGDLSAGATACDRALTLLRPTGDRWALAHAEALLGELAQAEHRYADATTHLDRAAQATGDLGFVAAQAHHLLNLGRAQHQAGDTTSSRATLQTAIDLGLRSGDTRTAALARTRLAHTLRGLGEIETAIDLAEQAVAWFDTAGGGDGDRLAAHVLAALHMDARSPVARQELVEVLGDARAVGDVLIEALTLDALAAIDARTGDRAVSLSELEAADAVFATHPSLWSGDRSDDEVARRELRAAR